MNYLSDMRLLRIFTAVFQQRSITGASRILNTTQPTITRSIHNLEIEMGTELFVRSPEGLIPTDFSYKLYKRALSIMDEVDSIFADAENLSSQGRTLLNLGLGHGCCHTVTTSLARFRDDHPEIVFSLKVASARHLLGEMENGHIEIIIGNKDTLQSAQWLTVKDFGCHHRYLAVRKNHPVLMKPEGAREEALNIYPYITYHLLEDSHGTTIPKAPEFRINDNLILLEHLSKSDAFMLIDEELLPFLERFDLTIVSDDRVEKIEYAAAYDEKNLSEPGRALLSFIL